MLIDGLELTPSSDAINITFSDISSTPTSLSGYGITDGVSSASKGAANGVASLGADSKILSAQLPSIVLTDTFVVGSQAAMLALTAQTGDVAVRTDLAKSFILKGTTASVLGDWQELLSPTSPVTSVAGRTGAVIIATTDIVNCGTNTIPQNSQSAAYTCVLTDGGKHMFHPSADTTARTYTIPANSSVAYPIGTALTFVNQNGAGVISIAITTDTMRLAGAGTTGTRSLAANGVATAIKLTATEWIISGTGLT